MASLTLLNFAAIWNSDPVELDTDGPVAVFL